jgi:hypothetical protein
VQGDAVAQEYSLVVLHRFFHRSNEEAKAVAVETCPAEGVPRREVASVFSRPSVLQPELRHPCHGSST